jgi:protein-S-isoprenylcysteine O-methyltransferase Ste14
MDIERTSKRYAVAQTVLLVLFAAVVFLSPRDYLFVSAGGVIAGNVLCAVGLLVIVLAFASLRGAIQIAPEPKPGAQLIETGIYKYLRHPIYTGIIFCVVGLFLRQPTVWMAVAVAMVIIFLFFKARLEEKLLLSVYPGYATYRSRTWGLLPGLHY